MKIGGLQKNTLIDYPGRLAAIVFLSGCNFRCPFCYSTELVLPEQIEKQPELSQKYFFDFLKSRKGLLEGVVICGGEPTINKDLPEFLKEIKSLGYLVKLDSNGSNPEALEGLLSKKLVDYTAMDIKAPPEKYKEATGVNIDVEKIKKSIGILKKNGNYEFRTTIPPGILGKEDIINIAKWISPAEKYYLQKFSAEKATIDPSVGKRKPYSDEYMEEMKNAVASFFDFCQLRG